MECLVVCDIVTLKISSLALLFDLSQVAQADKVRHHPGPNASLEAPGRFATAKQQAATETES